MAVQQRLWAASEELTGVKFPIPGSKGAPLPTEPVATT
ncbi:hypothetical protein RKD29_000164 [Streptomyces tendae]